MKWRTEIDKFELQSKIDYGTNIFTIGSCCAHNIAARLTTAKFRVTECPTGILFNPASVAAALIAFAEQRPCDPQRVVERGGGWVSLDCHSDLIEPTVGQAVSAYNHAIEIGSKALTDADCVIITLGTAWVYRHTATKRIVANCHKLPQSNFSRYRLGVDEIVEMFRPLLEGILRDKQVIFTVSPVRHTADTLAENSLSKAILRVAVATLCEQYNNAEYFPAYEIVTDDLRDYRFYADDLVHPSAQAIEYIWEKFADAAFSTTTKELLRRVEKVVSAAAHRPFNPHCEQYKLFCNNALKEAKSMVQIDFSAECAIFERYSDKS